ncbi:MAG: xanthine dehydrogenase family protein molybdopterin-binding subunit [Anaerolineaceae bacterium]|nr:xanthine dehydrogenase family protein molybdopterin-binding subunit [Anaerolineaceae bacterium]
MSKFKQIGRPKPLLDGFDKVTGRTRYAPDLTVPGMLHGRFVTSPHAHASIKNIDVSAALEVPGVTAVLTAADLPDIAPTARSRLLLARDKVIFAGQPVALVLAEDLGAAQDAVDKVWVDYEMLPAVVTLDEALADDAPLVWPSGMPGETGEAAAHGADVGGDKKEKKPSNIAGESKFARGDLAEGFAAADVVVERPFTTAMVHQSYLETFAMLVQPDPMGQGATVWTSTQAPFYVREEVADVLGVEETAVRVIPTSVGGAFGAKFLHYELLIAVAAQAVNRPVKLALTRSEDMLAANPAPSARFRIKLGMKQDGTITALEADVTFDTGCYPSEHGIAAFLMGSLYQIPHLEIRYTEVLTHKLSTAAYRAPGAPQAAFVLESTIDEAARQLNLDPIAVRLQNASQPGDPMAHGKPWSTMGMTEVLQRLQDHPAWQNRAEARAKGRGVGIALGGWPGGIEPTAASCQLHRDGTLHVHVGSVDLTGTTTGFSLIAAEAFGVTPDRVRVISGDTATASFAGATGGSKITYMVGPSVIKAAQDARQQVMEIAANELEADVADMEVVDGCVQVKGVPDRAIQLEDIAQKTMRFGGKYAPVVGNGRHANTTNSPGFAAQLAEVSVDAETGEVTVHKLVVVQDVGQVINPLTLEGQIMGGAMQGLGWALYEQMAHDSYGTPLTGSWMDYNVPHFIHAVPEFEAVFVEVPTEFGPFGARGAGEPPIIATAAAVGNAIADATQARLADLPMTAPRVIAALKR